MQRKKGLIGRLRPGPLDFFYSGFSPIGLFWV